MEDNQQPKQIHIKLSAELHKKMKIQAASNDVSIQDYVVKAIENQLENDNGVNNSEAKKVSKK